MRRRIKRTIGAAMLAGGAFALTGCVKSSYFGYGSLYKTHYSPGFYHYKHDNHYGGHHKSGYSGYGYKNYGGHHFKHHGHHGHHFKHHGSFGHHGSHHFKNWSHCY